MDINLILMVWGVVVFLCICLGLVIVVVIFIVGLVILLLVVYFNINLVLIMLVIGVGFCICFYVNDVSFWMIKDFFGLIIKEMLLFWMLMFIFLFISGLIFILFVSLVL